MANVLVKGKFKTRNLDCIYICVYLRIKGNFINGKLNGKGELESSSKRYYFG